MGWLARFTILMGISLIETFSRRNKLHVDAFSPCLRVLTLERCCGYGEKILCP